MAINKDNFDNASKQPDFEAALRELEELVQHMEQGDLPLEQSLATFERGVQLTRLCQERLNQAEQRVKLLSSQGEAQDFAPEDDAA